jgi:hypothetical protein
MSDKPNPGSDEAITIGCKCPRSDNAYGRCHGGAVLVLDERDKGEKE